MLAAPSRDWNVFKQIFTDHWDTFQRAHPRYQTPYYDSLIAKMLACGNPEKMGYIVAGAKYRRAMTTLVESHRVRTPLRVS